MRNSSSNKSLNRFSNYHKNSFSKKFIKKKAFSLVEASIVILIIGLIMAGITTGSILVSKSRLSVARNLTQNSAVNAIREGNLWLETSLNRSFSTNFDIDDNSPLTNNSWSNISQYNNGSITLSVAGSGDDVVYSNTINHIPGIKFNNAKYLTFDGSFLNGTDYTIIILDKRLTASDDNYFIGDFENTNSNESLLLGYSSTNQVIHSQSGIADDYKYSANIDSYIVSTNKARIFTFIHSQNQGNKTYINGYLASSNSDLTDHLFGVETLQIGKGYLGEIGEIIFFTKALKNEQRRDVERYLTKKFNVADSISLSLDLSGSGSDIIESCDGGSITSSGCVQTCAVSEVGISATVVNKGSGLLNCDKNGYSGEISYNCINSVFSTNDSCNCPSGSILDGWCSICSGGTITSSGNYQYHVFTEDDSFFCSQEVAIELLVVGGGGGSGSGYASPNICSGGGGGGGIYHNDSYNFDESSVSVQIGSGGSGGNYRIRNGGNGANTSFGSITAYGGGGGGGGESKKGRSGGSAGGNGTYENYSENYVFSEPTKTNQSSNEYGSYGYVGRSITGDTFGGGGGGAGENSETGIIRGSGGVGKQFSNFSNFGDNGYFGGGGAGGSSYYSLLGGSGGGGNNDIFGSPNTGGGAGGTCDNDYGTQGGSGIVIVRYNTTQ